MWNEQKKKLTQMECVRVYIVYITAMMKCIRKFGATRTDTKKRCNGKIVKVKKNNNNKMIKRTDPRQE